jgi:hypothetical protein
VGAAEQDEWLRAAWRVTLAQRIDPERLVFTDEMGADASLSIRSVPIHRRDGGRTLLRPARPRAEHDFALAHERGGHGNFSRGRRCDREAFEAYIGWVLSLLSPKPRPGQVVVMDNLSALTREMG